MFFEDHFVRTATYGTWCHFQQYFIDIVLFVEETGIAGENHLPATSQRQTLSHNVVSSTPRHERDLNS